MSDLKLADYGSGDGHLDLDVQPPYLMVPEHNHARVVVVNDDEVFLKSEKQNQVIAIIDPKHLGADGRIYEFTAVSVGSTFFASFERKGGGRLASRLQVDVLGERPIGIALHSVTSDKYDNKTKRDSGVHLRFLNLLNDIFKAQANCSFNATVSEDITIDTSFEDLLEEQQKQSYINKHFQMMQAACNPDVFFNIFFMPELDPQLKQLLNLNGILVFPDSMPDDKVNVALPHRIALGLFCSDITNDKSKHYLMYFKRADGEGDVKPGGKAPFIGRDTIRSLNGNGSVW